MSQDITLRQKIVHDDYTNVVNKMFDVPISDESEVIVKNNIKLPEKWNMGLIYGESGSGKTTLLKQFGDVKHFDWDLEKSVISQLNKVSPEEAAGTLSAVGFSSVPAWLRPYNCLSNGQKFRCDLARVLVEDDDLVLIDEFTSVVDRNVARAASFAIQKHIRRKNKQVILASCHADIIEWLCPDWIYNPIEGITHVLEKDGESVRFHAKYSELNMKRGEIVNTLVL